MSAHTHADNPDVVRVTLMKGLAILGVVVIHIFSTLPGHVYANVDTNFFYVAIDQLFRFSVPVFIGLSGYALTQKYARQLHLRSFYQRRLWRLIPLYLLWSVGLWLLFLKIPAWDTATTPAAWWQVLFFGRGDYHLYFVPLIIQFYVLFPLLLWIVRRYPWTLFFGALALQIVSILFFHHQLAQPEATFFTTDQAQYSLLISWLVYFVFGMICAKLDLKAARALAVFVFVLTGCFLIWQTLTQIAQGVDPLFALKFTRLSVIPFGVSAIFLSVYLPWERLPLPKVVMDVWRKIGELSFLIFLAHTLVLRLIILPNLPGIGVDELVLAVGFLICAVAVSMYLEKPGGMQKQKRS